MPDAPPPLPAANRWPPQIKYIVGNEACERFSYYGMRSILTGYITGVVVSDSLGHMTAASGLGQTSIFTRCGGFSSLRLRQLFYASVRCLAGRPADWTLPYHSLALAFLLRRAWRAGVQRASCRMSMAK